MHKLLYEARRGEAWLERAGGAAVLRRVARRGVGGVVGGLAVY